MYSGDWSLVVISNNGDADPIAFQRDFSLSVGVPSTVTITPTVTATDLETSVSSIVSTTSSIVTTTLVAKTTTKKALIAFAKPTLYSHPLSVQVVTRDLFTVTKTAYAPQVTQTTVEATPSCVEPTPNWIPDPLAKIEITILKTVLQKVNSAKFKRGVEIDAEVKRSFVEERKQRLGGLQKRAPDASVVTSTLTNTADFVTETQTQWTTITTTVPTTVLSKVYVSSLPLYLFLPPQPPLPQYPPLFLPSPQKSSLIKSQYLHTSHRNSHPRPPRLRRPTDFDRTNRGTHHHALGGCENDYHEECSLDCYDYTDEHA